jgi:hypothetical protein
MGFAIITFRSAVSRSRATPLESEARARFDDLSEWREPDEERQ